MGDRIRVVGDWRGSKTLTCREFEHPADATERKKPIDIIR